jgi:hypothetical protein
MMAAHGLDLLRPFDAIFFGAVGFPTVPDHVSLRGLRLPICQGFEQYVRYRPSVLLAGVRSPLAGQAPGDVDFVGVRENTEGEYAGAGLLLFDVAGPGRSGPGGVRRTFRAFEGACLGLGEREEDGRPLTRDITTFAARGQRFLTVEETHLLRL